MDCTRCKKTCQFDCFSQKSNGNYYLYCNLCREKSLEYNSNCRIYPPIDTILKCECGKSYKYFNKTSIIQHNNTKFHIKHCGNSKKMIDDCHTSLDISN